MDFANCYCAEITKYDFFTRELFIKHTKIKLSENYRIEDKEQEKDKRKTWLSLNVCVCVCVVCCWVVRHYNMYEIAIAQNIIGAREIARVLREPLLRILF